MFVLAGALAALPLIGMRQILPFLIILPVLIWRICGHLVALTFRPTAMPRNAATPGPAISLGR
jgi:hypothetical protein